MRIFLIKYGIQKLTNLSESIHETEILGLNGAGWGGGVSLQRGIQNMAH